MHDNAGGLIFAILWTQTVGSSIWSRCPFDVIRSHRNMVDGCRPNNSTNVLCSDRGDCVCGKCECHVQDNPEEKVSGTYCECDNFSCDRFKGQVCGGKGLCVCGTCQCLPGWTGRMCQCDVAETRFDRHCIRHGEDVVCSGHGSCHCGVCICNSGYSGTFCHLCPTCKNKCEQLRPCVYCQHDCSKCRLIPVEVADIKDGVTKQMCTFYDDDHCLYKFAYEEDYKNTTTLEVQKGKTCPANVGSSHRITLLISIHLLLILHAF